MGRVRVKVSVKLGFAARGRENEPACLPAWDLCQIKEGDLAKPTKCGWARGSPCAQALRGELGLV